MQLPLQITFRNMDHSDFLEKNIREHAAHLDQFAENIMSCRIIVEAPHKHKHHGNLYNVSIDIKLPNNEISVSHQRDLHQAHEDPYVAVRDAFDAARRQLQDFVRIQRGKVKHHGIPDHGRITSLVPMEDYGKIETNDGREVYFHRNSVLDTDFDALDIGEKVRFHEEMGEKGPQASTVTLVGKHHIVD